MCSETSQGKPSQPLSRSVTATVAGPQPDPITAAFSGMPEEHNGSEFTFDLAFSENVKAGFRRIRDKAFTLSGNSKVTRAKRKAQGSNQKWTITVDPKGNSDVTITLPETTDCDDDGAICTDEGGPLNHSTTDTVLGPVGVSIADAEVEEGTNAVLVFAVALSRAASSQMAIDYATSDGTATAGADYTGTSGTLTIRRRQHLGDSIDVDRPRRLARRWRRDADSSRCRTRRTATLGRLDAPPARSTNQRPAAQGPHGAVRPHRRGTHRRAGRRAGERTEAGPGSTAGVAGRRMQRRHGTASSRSTSCNSSAAVDTATRRMGTARRTAARPRQRTARSSATGA